MAVFVAASDESAGETQRDPFLFAGFVGPEEDWYRFFVPAWQERVLDGPPPIPYLHMTDIRREKWREQHKISRTEADARVDAACVLLDQMSTFYPIGIHVAGGHFRDTFADIKVTIPGRKAQPLEPDYICFLAYALYVLTFVHLKHPEAEKVDFIVERKMTVTRYIQEFHSHLDECLKAVSDPHLSPLVGELIPGDKDRIPLQAADLLCWHSARPKQTMDERDKRRYASIARRPGCQMEITEDEVNQMYAALSTPSEGSED